MAHGAIKRGCYLPQPGPYRESLGENLGPGGPSTRVVVDPWPAALNSLRVPAFAGQRGDTRGGSVAGLAGVGRDARPRTFATAPGTTARGQEATRAPWGPRLWDEGGPDRAAKGGLAGRRRKSRTEVTRTPHRRSPRFRPRTQPPRTPHRRRMPTGTRHHTTPREYHEHGVSPPRGGASRNLQTSGGGRSPAGRPRDAEASRGRGGGSKRSHSTRWAWRRGETDDMQLEERCRTMPRGKRNAVDEDRLGIRRGGGRGRRTQRIPFPTLPHNAEAEGPRSFYKGAVQMRSTMPDRRIGAEHRAPSQTTTRKPRNQREETRRLICVRPLDCTLRRT